MQTVRARRATLCLPMGTPTEVYAAFTGTTAVVVPVNAVAPPSIGPPWLEATLVVTAAEDAQGVLAVDAEAPEEEPPTWAAWALRCAGVAHARGSVGAQPRRGHVYHAVGDLTGDLHLCLGPAQAYRPTSPLPEAVMNFAEGTAWLHVARRRPPLRRWLTSVGVVNLQQLTTNADRLAGWLTTCAPAHTALLEDRGRVLSDAWFAEHAVLVGRRCAVNLGALMSHEQLVTLQRLMGG